MTEEKQIQVFLQELSSKQPTPGGGGASALSGALGAALGQMVANLTVGKKKYAQVEGQMQGYLIRMKQLMQEFAVLADKDEEVFAPLAQCYRLPSSTEEERLRKAEQMEQRLLAASLVPMEMMEKALEMLTFLEELADKGSVMAVSDAGRKAEQMEQRLLAASLVPMEMMEKALEMLTFLEELADKGSVMAVSDAGVGVQFIRTCLLGAVMNVYINTKSMEDREKACQLNEQAERMVCEGTKRADAIYEKVLEKLR